MLLNFPVHPKIGKESLNASRTGGEGRRGVELEGSRDFRYSD